MISVVIPLYNKEASIKQSLMSVLSQFYQEFEVVIVDDGSTDNSVAKVEEIQDSRIRLIRQENGGPSKARNTGVKNAKGEWILFLDADDDLLPDALSHFEQLTKAHPNYEFFACSSYYCKSGEQKTKPFNIKEGVLKNPYAAMFLHYYSPRTGDFIVSRRVALLCPFDESIRRFEDVECFFRIYKKVKVYLSPVPVLNENRDFAEASGARHDIAEDFVGHINMEGKSLWERLCLYRLFIEERSHYENQSRQLYPSLYKRYDMLVLLKIVMLLNAHTMTRKLLKHFLGRTFSGGAILLVCAHKEDPFIRRTEPYMPLQAGKALHQNLSLGFQGDDEGDNISLKNSSWSELTVLYWGWKNVKNVEYLGLVHYRRYFDLNINASNIEAIMSGYDMLTVNESKGFEPNMNRNGLIMSTSQEDFYIFLDTLLGHYPQYRESIIDYFYNHYSFVPFTMFLAKKEIYDDYCSFIFPVLFEVEKRIKPREYSRQKRVIGYFGEWSLGMYILCKNLKTKTVPFVMCGNDNHTRPQAESFTFKLKWNVKVWKDRLRHHFVRRVVVPSDVRAALRRDGIELNNLD